MDLFYADKSINQEISWAALLEDLNKTSVYNTYCYKAEFYEIFKHIIQSLLLNEELIVLDNDFSETELYNILGDVDLDTYTRPLNKHQVLKITSKEELLKRITAVNKNWKITLFTSGTTGLPKKVSHSFKSITRFVKYNNDTQVNWGFAFNPTHMAGLQVFFQALLNGNSLFRLFGIEKQLILSKISEYSITNISATPTFYRMLLPLDAVYDSVKRLTFGGEKFDKNIWGQLKKSFPNAKFNNIYASTEVGSLLVSSGDVFSIKPELNSLVKIVDNELIIHNSLLGEIDRSDSDWYHTNDLVEVINDNTNQFRFVSRKNEMINVGGYKVNPYEVEQVVLDIKGINQVRIYTKSNSILGNIICCEIVSENKNLTESDIRKILRSKLQEYKIPRFITFVNEIAMTRTGKIKRH